MLLKPYCSSREFIVWENCSESRKTFLTADGDGALSAGNIRLRFRLFAVQNPGVCHGAKLCHVGFSVNGYQQSVIPLKKVHIGVEDEAGKLTREPVNTGHNGVRPVCILRGGKFYPDNAVKHADLYEGGFLYRLVFQYSDKYVKAVDPTILFSVKKFAGREDWLDD